MRMDLMEDILGMKDEKDNTLDSGLEGTIDSLRRDDTVEVKFHPGCYSSSTIGYFVKCGRNGLVLARDRRPKGMFASMINILHRQTVPYEMIKDIRMIEQYDPCEETEHEYKMEDLKGCDDYDRQYELRLH